MRPISLVLILLVTSPVFGNHWQWTRKASHHDAAVAVRCGNHGGTGTLVHAAGGRGLVVTAYHVIETKQSIVVTWRGGHKSAGRYTAGAYGSNYDIAVIEVTTPKNPVVIPVSNSAPQRGETIEVLGYGGAAASPSTGLRHFSGQVIETGSTRLLTSTRVISGDSGSGIIADGELVGVVSGYRQPVGAINEGGQRWEVGTPTVATAAPFLRRFLGIRCGPNGCMPEQSPTLPPVQSPTLPPTQPPMQPQPDITAMIAESRRKAEAYEADRKRRDAAAMADIEANAKRISDLQSDMTDLKNRINRQHNEILSKLAERPPQQQTVEFDYSKLLDAMAKDQRFRRLTPEEVIDKIPPRVVEIMDPDGKLIDSDRYSFDEPIRLILRPRGGK